MSMRAPEDAPAEFSQQTTASAMRLRADIDQARAMQMEDKSASTAGAAGAADLLHFDDLTETEKSAAMIGASPDDWKPIGFMNQAHYRTLLENNALAGALTQKIEAYKQVAGNVVVA